MIGPIRKLPLYVSLFFATAVAMTPTATLACGAASSGTTCGGADVASQGNTSGTNQGAGNPINIITGNKFQRAVDMPPLPGVLGLEIVRYYNSALAGVHAPSGGFGRGWHLSYDTRLYRIHDTLQIMQADGTRLIFQHDSEHPSRCATHNPQDGRLQRELTSDRLQYVWTWTNGRRLTFDRFGHLTLIQAPGGETVHLYYNDRGELAQVVDPQGRRLILHYPTPAQARRHDRFNGVQSIDSPLGRFKYDYGSLPPHGFQGSLRELLANLTSVVYPNRARRYYYYEDARFPGALTGIAVAEAPQPNSTQLPRFKRIRTWAYDNKGRGILSVLGRPLRLDKNGKPVPGTGIGQVTLSYPNPDKTVLTNSLGQKTVYIHKSIAGQHRLLSVIGAGCTSCGEANVRYRYDSLGRLVGKTKLASDGTPLRSYRIERDALGRIVETKLMVYQHGKPTPTGQWVRYRYTGNANQPSQIIRPSVVAGREHRVAILYNDHGQPIQVTETGFSPATKAHGKPVPLSRTTSYDYRDIGGHSVLTRIDGPLPDGPMHSPADSDVTEIKWDRKGNQVARIISPLNLVARYTYGRAGRIKSVVDPDGVTMRFQDNLFGRPEKVLRLAAGHSHGWGFQYDAQDRLIQVSSLDNGHARPQIRMHYDVAGRLLWQASAKGILRKASYDTEGRVLQVSVRSAGHQQTERYGYDRQGRLVLVNDGTGARYRLQYGRNGRLQSVIGPLGHITRLSFDQMGRPASVTTAAGTDLARTVSVSLAHGMQSVTVASALKNLHPPVTTTLTQRDDFGRTVAIVRPNSGKTSYRYDPDNRLTAITDALGQVRHYRYDLAGRLIHRYVTQISGNTAPQSVTNYRYRGSRLIEVASPAQTTRYAYNAWGRLTAKTVILSTRSGRITATTQYAYGPQDDLKTITLPDDSLLRYVRNGQGQIVAVKWRDGPHGPTRTLVSHLRRDLVGLTELTYGNGIQARWQRSRAGVLARILYRLPGRSGQGPRTAGNEPAHPAWNRLLDMMIPQAMAGEPKHTPHKGDWPGAYGLPEAPGTLWDARYLYGDLGNILAIQHQGSLAGGITQSRYGYDVQNELIQARYGLGPVFAHQKLAPGQVQTTWVAQPPSRATAWRYLLDGNANRLYAQQNNTQSRPAKTQAIRYRPGTLQLLGTDYDALGQTLGADHLQFHWNADDRLQSLWDKNREIARYRYNAAGERIAKIVDPHGHAKRTYYLYDPQRHRQAKLDASGQLLRQYLWLGDKLVAVVDYPQGRKLLPTHKRSGVFDQVGQDLSHLWHDRQAPAGRISYLLDNHLGAPIAATDAHARVIWQAHYGPHGQLLGARNTAAGQRFSLSLRNPGQWQDRESGLYYNDQRYYDPATGRYLSPDPLGLAGGLNAYAYVAANPVSFVDPYGLMLFAFDGTDNGAPGHLVAGDTTSNIWKFYSAYHGTPTDPAYYITGIGTTYPEAGQTVKGNDLTGSGFQARLGYATHDLQNFIISNKPTPANVINLDVVGFSRGAAEARDWVNLIAAQTHQGLYSFTQQGQSYSACINFRFEGLFDTVPHYGAFSQYNSSLDLSIPTQVKYAVQAVALNENRGGLTNFDAYSIMPTPTTPNSTTPGDTRIEQGFIGSHSDIGGGYGVPGTTNGTPSGDLSNVAYTWMYDQAQAAGVTELTGNDYNTVNSPILHDEVAAHLYYFNGRVVYFGNGTSIPETAVQINSAGTPSKVTQTWTKNYITYNHHYVKLKAAEIPSPPCPNDQSIVGMVDMKTYGAWLKSIGVNITSSDPSPTTQMCQ